MREPVYGLRVESPFPFLSVITVPIKYSFWRRHKREPCDEPTSSKRTENSVGEEQWRAQMPATKKLDNRKGVKASAKGERAAFPSFS